MSLKNTRLTSTVNYVINALKILLAGLRSYHVSLDPRVLSCEREDQPVAL